MRRACFHSSKHAHSILFGACDLSTHSYTTNAARRWTELARSSWRAARQVHNTVPLAAALIESLPPEARTRVGLAQSLPIGRAKWRFENARPDADFRYRFESTGGGLSAELHQHRQPLRSRKAGDSTSTGAGPMDSSPRETQLTRRVQTISSAVWTPRHSCDTRTITPVSREQLAARARQQATRTSPGPSTRSASPQRS